MSKKGHGSCRTPVQMNLRYGCDYATADRISCYNRHYAEHGGYAFEPKMTWLSEIREEWKATKQPITYYDSVTGKPLFKAPVGRTLDQFIIESEEHGWPSFRDEEVDWENVRCLADGETVSTDGTHLGHNLPD